MVRFWCQGMLYAHDNITHTQARLKCMACIGVGIGRLELSALIFGGPSPPCLKSWADPLAPQKVSVMSRVQGALSGHDLS